LVDRTFAKNSSETRYHYVRTSCPTLNCTMAEYTYKLKNMTTKELKEKVELTLSELDHIDTDSMTTFELRLIRRFAQPEVAAAIAWRGKEEKLI